MKHSSIIVTSCLALALGFAPSASASLISVAGSGIIIGAPAFIGDPDNPLATHQQGFDEMQGVFLFGALPVDAGAIGPGVTVDSHMIFFNQSGTGPLVTTAHWTFSGTILGVMSDTAGVLEGFSSPFLGASGTLGYPPGGFPLRGMESDDSYAGVGTSTLRVTMHIAQPGDWIRVITVHVPDGGSAGTLLGLGLLALAALRRTTGKVKQ